MLLRFFTNTTLHLLRSFWGWLPWRRHLLRIPSDVVQHHLCPLGEAAVLLARRQPGFVNCLVVQLVKIPVALDSSHGIGFVIHTSRHGRSYIDYPAPNPHTPKPRSMRGGYYFIVTNPIMELVIGAAKILNSTIIQLSFVRDGDAFFNVDLVHVAGTLPNLIKNARQLSLTTPVSCSVYTGGEKEWRSIGP